MLSTEPMTGYETMREYALDILKDHGHLMLRRVSDREDKVSAALWLVVFPPGNYDYDDVRATVKKIEASNLTLAQWLKKGCKL